MKNLTYSYLEQQYRLWERSILLNEPLNILLFPGSNRYEPVQFSNRLQDKYGKHVTYIDIRTYDDITSQKKLIDLLEDKQNKYLVIFANPEIIFTKQPNQLLEKLQQHKDNATTGIIIFYELLPYRYQDFIKPFPFTFLYNFRIYKLPTTAELDIFIKYYEDFWKFKISQKIKSDLYHNTGGNLHLAKEVIRQLYYNPAESLQNITGSEPFQFKLEMINQRLGSKVTDALIHIDKPTSTQQIDIIDNLEQFNFFTDTQHNLPLIWQQKIKQFSDHFEINQHEITLRGVDISPHFTSSERRILIHFYNHFDTLINRESVAALYWQGKIDKQYSEWAIDQLIYRIRKKIENLNLPLKLNTIRNHGYMMTR